MRRVASVLMVSAVSLSITAPSYASDLSLTIGGMLDSQAGYYEEQIRGISHRGDVEAKNDTEVHILARGMTDNHIVYGAVIELEADVTADGNGEGLNADKTYLFFEKGALGRVELGANKGAQGTMKVDASTIARATGGIDGDWHEYVSTFFAFHVTPGGIRPELPVGNGNNITGVSQEDAVKITYYTPLYHGMQAGISLTPDTGNLGTAASFDTNIEDRRDQRNLVGLALNGTKALTEELMVQGSLTAEFGKAESKISDDVEDVGAWAIGAVIHYKAFSFAGSYSDWRSSTESKAGLGESEMFTVGVAYDADCWGLSATYLQSEGNSRVGPFGRRTGEFSNLVIGTDYTIAPGLTSYIETSFFDMDGKTYFPSFGSVPPTNYLSGSEGSVMMAGVEIVF